MEENLKSFLRLIIKRFNNFLKKLDNKEKIFILGAGSNTLITDGLFDGVVIKLVKILITYLYLVKISL